METHVTDILIAEQGKPCVLPFYLESINAGFPSPAADYVEGKLDLNEYLIKHPAATFMVRVTGESMVDAGIHSQDLLVVDRSLEPVDGRIVIAVIDGELTVKRLRKKNGQIWLMAENGDYPPIHVTADVTLLVWGVVTAVIHPV